ncbi:MAG: hypothetical protein J6O73_07740 [Lachnospiraceae bacterium]|nr:hypothetical protein [Lachnospiraceae bacterium]
MFSITVPTEALLMFAGTAAMADMEAIVIDQSDDGSFVDLSAVSDLEGFSLGSLPDISSGTSCSVKYNFDGYCTFPFSFQDFAVIYGALENSLQSLQEEIGSKSGNPENDAVLLSLQAQYRDLRDRLQAYSKDRGLPLPEES